MGILSFVRSRSSNTLQSWAALLAESSNKIKKRLTTAQPPLRRGGSGLGAAEKEASRGK